MAHPLPHSRPRSGDAPIKWIARQRFMRAVLTVRWAPRLTILAGAITITLLHALILLALSASPGIEAAFRDLAREDADRHPSLVTKGFRLVAAAGTTIHHMIASPGLVGAPGFKSAYHRLAQWDTDWYTSIVNEGYSLAMTAGREMNVAFFPGYPTLARLFQKLLGLDTKTALLVAAQSACIGFWTYFLLLLRSWNVTWRHALCGVFAVASFPSAFYLVAGYSESLFLFGLLGMIWWWNRPPSSLRFLSGVHGLVMSSTRLIGLPLCLYPVVSSLFGMQERTTAAWGRAFGTSGVAALGTAGFYAYLHWRFGNWNLYAIANAQGQSWQTKPDYLAFLDWRKVLLPSVPRLDAPPEHFGRLLTALMLWGLAAMVVAELLCRTRQRWREQRYVRLGLYFSAAAMLYVYVTATHSSYFFASLRLMVTVQVVLTLAVLHLQVRLARGAQRVIFAALLVYGIAGALFQAVFAYRFMRGEWVA